MLSAILKQIDRTRRAWVWERRWTTPSYAPKWEIHGVPAELVEAHGSGWLPPQGRALDIGCGHGDITAWLAERGYATTGLDVSRTVVREAQARHANLPRIEFVCKDISSDPLPARHYNVLVDRGCYHGLPTRVIPDYVANIHAAAAPETRMLLFIKAFRGGRPFGDENEVRRQATRVREAFAGRFEVERYAATYLNAASVREGQDPLPGMVFWLRVS